MIITYFNLEVIYNIIFDLLVFNLKSGVFCTILNLTFVCRFVVLDLDCACCHVNTDFLYPFNLIKCIFYLGFTFFILNF